MHDEFYPSCNCLSCLCAPSFYTFGCNAQLLRSIYTPCLLQNILLSCCCVVSHNLRIQTLLELKVASSVSILSAISLAHGSILLQPCPWPVLWLIHVPHTSIHSPNGNSVFANNCFRKLPSRTPHTSLSLINFSCHLAVRTPAN